MAKAKTDQRKKLKHPMQPIGIDGQGVVRFKENKIVSYLVEQCRNIRVDLNYIAIAQANGVFSREDYEQLMQLIGYSVCGFCEIDDRRVSPKAKDAAWAIQEKLTAKKR